LIEFTAARRTRSIAISRAAKVQSAEVFEELKILSRVESMSQVGRIQCFLLLFFFFFRLETLQET
jgi:hypothetical protein